MVCENGGLNGVKKQICNKPLKKNQWLVTFTNRLIGKKMVCNKKVKKSPKKKWFVTKSSLFSVKKNFNKVGFRLKKKVF